MTWSGARRLAEAGDLDLVALAARGDGGAYEQLVAPRLARLYRMAVAILRHEADANDAVQDACIQAWRELPRLREAASFDAWLSQILVNSCRASLRRRGRSGVREISVEGNDTTTGSLGVPSGDAALGEQEAIVRAFARLGEAERTLLSLHYVEELPLAEIGRLTGSPAGTVKWRLFNARRALDRALKVERR